MLRHILSLPDCLFLEILCYLNFREKLCYKLVCRRWESVLEDWKLWEKIDIKPDPGLCYRIKDATIERWTAAWGSHILELSLDGCYWLTDPAICYIAQYCSNLQRLSLKDCTQVSDVGITEISRFCSRLRAIDFRLTRVSERGFELLVANNPGIHKFRLSSQGNCRKMVQAICRSNCTKVTELVLQDCIDAERLTLDDDTLRTFVERFPMLEKLHLSWCIHVTDHALAAVARQCKALRSMHIKECPKILGDGIRLIAERCRLLNDMCIARQQGMTDDCCYAIRDHLRHMTSLTLVDTSVTDRGIEAIVTTNGGSLRTLRFGENSFCWQSEQSITGQCLAAIAQYCKVLQKLHIYSVVMDDDMLLLVCGRELRDLSLGDCCRMSSSALVELAGKCTNLRELRLHACVSFQDTHLEMMADKMTRLNYLKVLGHNDVTEQAVNKFSEIRPECVVRIDIRKK